MTTREQPDLRPVTVTVDPARRLVQLFAGLALYGASLGMMTRAHLGLAPWSVLEEGIMKHTPLSYGTVLGIVSVFVLLLWIPIRQRPGIGTVANIVVISLTVDLVRFLLPDVHVLGLQIPLLVGGVVLNAVATSVYVGARLGPGPRDGLMTGFAARTGASLRLVRVLIELTVLAAGWLLGGTVGVGTVLYALAIGPLTQLVLRWTTYRVTPPAEAHP